jgi:hypothetical protein
VASSDSDGVPLTCSAEYKGIHSQSQINYCSQVEKDAQMPFQIGDAAASARGFIQLWGGRDQCAMTGSDTDLWKLASADAGLQYLHKLFGCKCAHCGIAAALASKEYAAHLPHCPLLQTLCGMPCL